MQLSALIHSPPHLPCYFYYLQRKSKHVSRNSQQTLTINLVFFTNISDRVLLSYRSQTHSTKHLFQVSLTPSYQNGHLSQIPFTFMHIGLDTHLKCLLQPYISEWITILGASYIHTHWIEHLSQVPLTSITETDTYLKCRLHHHYLSSCLTTKD